MFFHCLNKHNFWSLIFPFGVGLNTYRLPFGVGLNTHDLPLGVGLNTYFSHVGHDFFVDTYVCIGVTGLIENRPLQKTWHPQTSYQRNPITHNLAEQKQSYFWFQNKCCAS